MSFISFSQSTSESYVTCNQIFILRSFIHHICIILNLNPDKVQHWVDAGWLDEFYKLHQQLTTLYTLIVFIVCLLKHEDHVVRVNRLIEETD